MAVKVQYLRPGANTAAENEYSEAEFVDIEDGHLMVRKKESSGSRRTVAIYAPGKWTKAVVE